MIITRKKSENAILKALEGKKSILLMGCGSCAASCETGGEHEVRNMAEFLKNSGKSVAGMIVVDETCHIPLVKKDLRAKTREVEKADAALVLSCGAGVQAVSAALDIPVYPGLDSMFLGTTNHHGDFSELCSMCGECILDSTGGICPVTRCPKGMLNGPCGGMNRGKCEINPDNDCIFCLIWDRMKTTGELKKLLELKKPKAHSKKGRPGRAVLDRKAARGGK